jgi:hypothetical protein
VITFQADAVGALEEEFRKSVDVYLQFCQEIGREPGTVCWLPPFCRRGGTGDLGFDGASGLHVHRVRITMLIGDRAQRHERWWSGPGL